MEKNLCKIILITQNGNEFKVFETKVGTVKVVFDFLKNSTAIRA